MTEAARMGSWAAEAVRIENDREDLLWRSCFLEAVRNVPVNPAASAADAAVLAYRLRTTKPVAAVKAPPAPGTPVTMQGVLEEVCRRKAISVRKVKGESRSPQVTFPRAIAMYLCRELCKDKFEAIGEFFRRDHSTVQHACGQIRDALGHDEDLRKLVCEVAAVFGCPCELPALLEVDEDDGGG